MSRTEANRITSAKTGSASAQSGGVAVSGIVNGNVFSGAPARSRYEEQVRRIAPPELLDRQEELAELAAFCTAPDVPSRYVWWRAEAWAGKSALMSWFVLHPPSAVRIVSFFITARLARAMLETCGSPGKGVYLPGSHEVLKQGRRSRVGREGTPRCSP